MDMSTYFNDPDGDALTYLAASSNAMVVSASVGGNVVSLGAITQGTAMVTVTARDPGGLSVQQSFTVTVPNRAPTAVGTIPDQTLSAGQTFRLDVSVYFDDPDGDALNFTAASANAGVVSVMIAGSTVTITGVAPGTTMVTVTAADPGGMSAQQTFAVTVPNRGPVAVGTIPAQTVARGQTVTVDVSPFFSDPDGQTLSYAAASSHAGVATVTVAGSSVTVAGVAAGTVMVTVKGTDSGQLSAQQRFSVTVTGGQAGAPEVVSTIPDLTLTVGEERGWTGGNHFRDPNGDPLTYAAGSSNAAVVLAVVSGGTVGIVALSPGTATVTVTASDPGGLSARLSFQVTVRPVTQVPVVISGIEPSVLVEGASARITGSGFSIAAAQNQVSVGGLAARVTSASATSLSIVVPWSDCLPPRRDELRVSVGSQSDARTVGVTPRTQDDLELQQYWYRYSYAGNGCVHLPGGVSAGEYLIGVVSTSEVPSSVARVTLVGTAGDASVVGADRSVVALPRPSSDVDAMASLEEGQPIRRVAASAPPSMLEDLVVPDDSIRMNWAQAHNRIMARNEALLRELGRAGRPPLGPVAADAHRAVEVGDTLTLYAGHGGTCSEAGQVQAVVRLVGNNTVWLDDLENPSATFSDSELADLDAFYAARVKGVHDDYFGALSDVDGNGRLLVLMTKEVNRRETAYGWVSFRDLYPSEQCATSNQAEIFYGQVPDPDGSFGDAVTKQSLLDYYPSLLAHEVTHLVQANSWVFGQARYARWELEGGATLATQLVAYGLFGHGSGQNLGRHAYNTSPESQYWYWNTWIADMAQFFGWDHRGDGSGRIAGAPEQCSWIGRPEEGNNGPCLRPSSAVYGVPSMVFRYAMDRWGGEYPGGEQALMTHLTQSSALGFAALEDVSTPARPIEGILADFYIALWADGRIYDAYGMSTWNLYDIFSSFRDSLRLQPYTSLSGEPQLSNVRIRAGSSLYLHWTPSGSLSPTAIKVTSADGSPVPNHISVWALRIR